MADDEDDVIVACSATLVISIVSATLTISDRSPGARFTKYLTTILRLSYDNAKVTIDLRQTSN